MMERKYPVSLRVTEGCFDLVGDFEGRILYSYDDADPKNPPTFIKEGMPVKGTLTIGSGHTHGVKPGQTITDAERITFLRADLREAESLVHRFIRAPLTQNEFDALVSLIFNVGPGRVAGSLGPDDKGKAGIITLTNGKPSGLRSALEDGDYATAAHWFTAWRKTVGAEYGLFRRRIAEMLLFMGLPWKRALNACSSLQFTIDEAVRLAEEERDDLEGLLRPPEPKPAPAASPAPRDELVLDDPIQIPPVMSEPAPAEAAGKGPGAAPATQSAPPQVPVQPEQPAVVESKVPAGEKPPPITVPTPPAAATPRPPPTPVPMGQQTGAVNASRNSEDWSQGAKHMIQSRRFWGLALVMFGRLWMLKSGSTAVLSAVSDPLVTEMFSGFAVMIVGELIQHWGERRATRPLK